MVKIKEAFQFALLFFVLGTLLFVIQLIIGEISIVTIIGLYYVILAVIINVIKLFHQLSILLFRKDKIMTLKSIGVILINIPIAYLYFFIVTNYLI